MWWRDTKWQTNSIETKRKQSLTRKLLKLSVGKNNPMHGKLHSEEAKKKMSLAKKGKPMPIEIKRKISLTLKGKMVGNKNPMFGKRGYWKGKRRPLQTKLKIKQNHKGMLGKKQC